MTWTYLGMTAAVLTVAAMLAFTLHTEPARIANRDRADALIALAELGEALGFMDAALRGLADAGGLRSLASELARFAEAYNR